MATRTRKRIIDNAMTELRSMCVFASSGEDEESALCLLAISKMVAVTAMSRCCCCCSVWLRWLIYMN